MATNLEDLHAIVAAEKASGKNYMMMETAAYDRACLYVQELYERGEIGRIQFLRGAHYQDMEGWPSYWRGLPPMLYATHAVAPLLSIAGTRARKVFCLGSGKLGPTIQQPGANTFPLQTAIFRLDGTDVAAEVTRSWFQTARPYTEAFSVYGDAAGFEWQQVESEEPVLYEMQQPVADQRGREVTARRYLPPLRPDLYPAELAEFADGWHGGSHPHLAHEFVRSIVEDRPPAIDEVTSADWTAPGICANESSLREGEPVAIPRY
jgi:predicted dehydrogenase